MLSIFYIPSMFAENTKVKFLKLLKTFFIFNSISINYFYEKISVDKLLGYPVSLSGI